MVFDTSVLVTLAVPASRSTRLFLRLQRAGWRVATSPQILEEAAEKLRTKERLRRWLSVSDEDIDGLILRLARTCRLVDGIAQAHGAVPDDPKDDMVVAAAVEARAGYLVSEDKHLLDLQSCQGIRILNREQMEAELDRLGVPKVESE